MTLVSQTYLRIVQGAEPQNLLKLIRIMFPKRNSYTKTSL